MAFASLLVKLVQQRFDLGGRRPVVHQNAIDDRILFHRFSGLFNGRLFQINGEGDVTLRTVYHRGIVERLNIILCTFATELMATTRPNRILRRLITDPTDQDIESRLHVFLQDEIGMIRDLPHLHDQTEDIGVVIEHDTPADVGVKLAGRVSHDTAGEIMFNLAEKFIMNGNSAMRNELTAECRAI